MTEPKYGEMIDTLHGTVTLQNGVEVKAEFHREDKKDKTGLTVYTALAGLDWVAHMPPTAIHIDLIPGKSVARVILPAQRDVSPTDLLVQAMDSAHQLHKKVTEDYDAELAKDKRWYRRWARIYRLLVFILLLPSAAWNLLSLGARTFGWW